MPNQSGLDTRPTNAGCVIDEAQSQPVELKRIWPNLTFPGPVTAIHAASLGRWYVTALEGQIFTFDDSPDPLVTTTALDIRDQVNDRGESGLSAIALHPDFASNGALYAFYTAQACTDPGCPAAIIRLARFRSDDGGLTFHPQTEEILLEVEQTDPNLWHVNADMHFGPDGYLYLAIGDGGSPGDADDNAQNPFVLLGKVLRVDVDAVDPARLTAYAIPPDNPFADGLAGAPEVFALGLRSPWRMSFDRATGELWLGDVGEDYREEINTIVAGGNYGWPIREGTMCFRTQPCDSTGLIDPFVDYDHGTDKGASITLGYVYRGAAMPELVGKLIYADFVTGRIGAVDADRSDTMLQLYDGFAVSFAESADGELVLLDFIKGAASQLVLGAPAGAQPFPALLSQTGCMDPANPKQPGAGLIPYDLNVPFWSDGVDKRRWLAIPDDAQLTVEDNGHILFPPSSVLVKEFLHQGQHIETRLLVRHQDGRWLGYSYVWDHEQTDARLIGIDQEITKAWGDLVWDYPTRSQCLQCHGQAAGRSLGPSIAQLDRDLTYPTTQRTANQLHTYQRIGLIADSTDFRGSAMPAIDSAAPLELRARAWLASNCANCHQPNGGGQSDFDLRFSTPLQQTNTCNVASLGDDLGIDGAKFIVPGEPEKSILYLRLSTRTSYQMPPIGSRLVDEQGARLVFDWIQSLSACP